VEAKAFSFSV
jgi:hypothetical protein